MFFFLFSFLLVCISLYLFWFGFLCVTHFILCTCNRTFAISSFIKWLHLIRCHQQQQHETYHYHAIKITLNFIHFGNYSRVSRSFFFLLCFSYFTFQVCHFISAHLELNHFCLLKFFFLRSIKIAIILHWLMYYYIHKKKEEKNFDMKLNTTIF